jgi:hypothetical protein
MGTFQVGPRASQFNDHLQAHRRRRAGGQPRASRMHACSGMSSVANAISTCTTASFSSVPCGRAARGGSCSDSCRERGRPRGCPSTYRLYGSSVMGGGWCWLTLGDTKAGRWTERAITDAHTRDTRATREARVRRPYGVPLDSVVLSWASPRSRPSRGQDQRHLGVENELARLVALMALTSSVRVRYAPAWSTRGWRRRHGGLSIPASSWWSRTT